MRIPAHVEVDRSQAPHDNFRLLPHNMRVEILDSNILVITELGSDFRLKVVLHEHVVHSDVSHTPIGSSSLDWL